MWMAQTEFQYICKKWYLFYEQSKVEFQIISFEKYEFSMWVVD